MHLIKKETVFHCNFEKVNVGQYYDTEVLISVIVIHGIEMCPASPGGYNWTKVQDITVKYLTKMDFRAKMKTILYGQLIYFIHFSEVSPRMDLSH